MPSEYVISILLLATAIITSVAAAISTRRALAQHTKLLRSQQELIEQAKRSVRADLHKRASTIFEKAIDENAEYIKHDIEKARTSMVSYVKDEFDKALASDMRTLHASVDHIQSETAASISGIQEHLGRDQVTLLKQIQERQIAVLDSLEEQHKSLAGRIDTVVNDEKARRIEQFEDQMTQIVRSYINEALVNQVDIETQMDAILDALEQNKTAMVEDMKNAA